MSTSVPCNVNQCATMSPRAIIIVTSALPVSGAAYDDVHSAQPGESHSP